MKKFACVLMTMLALLVVATPIDAQTRKKSTTRTTATTKKKGTAGKKTTAATAKPEAVDMGLSVKWCNMDLGAPNSTTAGALYSPTTDVAAVMGEGWRVPTAAEFQEPINATDKQIYLTNSGSPSYVELTSKNNGAKIKFYIPKVAVQGAAPLSNPSQGNYFICPGNQECFLYAIVAMPSNQQLRSKLKELIRDYKLESADMSKWPDEVKNAITQRAPGLIVDNAFTYLGKVELSQDAMDGAMFTLRPVYQVNDED